ncbi:peptidyl-tRNA hydrolase [Brachybacterium endophyticum]|uniref:Peptidyl-tRNA hydrolase n=2 Tax=Brachybacterium endophyticum TaxID=2182385 RepID=A0A2U2RMC5_9MICO|nr:peptidyl-tRNA hydrolase [Brachybacterium endophyticum]
MQLVVERVRADPSAHVDVVEAAAQAVVQLLDDERARTGEWAAEVRHWREGWIRKVVRRADGARWEAVQELPGVTVAHGSARVRAFVPGPLSPLPKALGKLQVGGTEFPREKGSSADGARVDVEITPLAELSSGKTAAQAGHAAQLLYEQMDEAAREAWRADGFAVRASVPAESDWAEPGEAVRVIDAGLTEVDGPTETARARLRA